MSNFNTLPEFHSRYKVGTEHRYCNSTYGLCRPESKEAEKDEAEERINRLIERGELEQGMIVPIPPKDQFTGTFQQIPMDLARSGSLNWADEEDIKPLTKYAQADWSDMI